MAKRSRTIPKASAARILNNAGAERVSDAAAGTFADILEEIATEICEHAVKIAKHSGRKTVQSGDIKLAARD